MQIDSGLIVVVLCVSVPVLIVFGVYFRSARNDRKDGSASTRFLGTQMDIAILILVFFLLLGLAGWMRETFSG